MAVEGNGQGDMQAHLETYSLFNTLMKWGAIVCAVTVLVIVTFLAGRH